MPKAPLFMTYSGLRPYKPRQRPGGQAPREAQRQRQHEVGMARESRAGDLTARREAWVQRQMEQRMAAGVNITPELEAAFRKAGGLGGVAPGGPRTYLGAPMSGEPAGMKDWRERREPGRDPAMFPRTRPPGGVTTGPQQFGQYSTGRPMPGKVTGREQTIYGDLPKNYYERQREMNRRGLVLVNGRWMTRQMRDELSRHKWGKATQERIDRIEGGEDRSYFNFTTPSGESAKLSGTEMRAITALAESAKRGTVPEGLQLTPDQIANIRRYHEVVERGGEAARLDQSEAQFERQLDRLGEWQDVAAPLQRELGSEYGAMEPGTGRAGDLGVSREQLDRLQLTDEQLDSPTMREYRGRVAGMGGIRQELMGRAIGALDEVDAARAATQTPRPEFRERMALLPESAPTPEGAAPTAAPARVGDDWDWGPEGRPDQAGIIRGYIDSGIDPRKYGFTDQQIAAAQGGPAADMNRRLGDGASMQMPLGAGASMQMPLGARSQVDARLDPGLTRQDPRQVPMGPFTEAPQAPLARSPRPDWLSPTDDRMVDEKAWLKRIEPYTRPAGGEGLPGIPQKRDVGQLALESQYTEAEKQKVISGDLEVQKLLSGTGNTTAAAASLQRLIASGTVDIPSITRTLTAIAAEGGEAVANQVNALLGMLRPRTPTGATLPGAAPGQLQPGQPPAGGVVQQIVQPRQEPLRQLLQDAVDTIGRKGDVGIWYSRDDYRRPIIKQLGDPKSQLSKMIDTLMYDLRDLPAVTRKGVVRDMVYNSLFNVLDAFALDRFGANSKQPNYGSRDTTLWVYPRNFASDVAGSVNQALEQHLSTKLGM